jgi:DNA-binding NarL/FixJ family response regulator
MTRLRIVLAEDHGIVREGVKRLIHAEGDMDVVGEAVDGEETLVAIRTLQPDVAVVDVALPRLNGIQVTRQLLKDAPNVRVVALTVHEDVGYAREMVDAGAHGYVLKRAAPADLIRAIRIVAEGGVYLDPHVAGKSAATDALPMKRRPALSERENRVLTLISEGYSNREIAEQLGLSVKSVETYKFRAMEKLSLRTRVDVVRYIRERALFPD